MSQKTKSENGQFEDESLASKNTQAFDNSFFSVETQKLIQTQSKIGPVLLEKADPNLENTKVKAAVNQVAPVNFQPIEEEEEQQMSDKVVFEFAVTGMSCVNCTRSVEGKMNEEFSSKQLVSVTIILLTHKMVATFEASVFHDKQVTPEMVCEVIESIGFNCTLVSITELKGEE